MARSHRLPRDDQYGDRRWVRCSHDPGSYENARRKNRLRACPGGEVTLTPALAPAAIATQEISPPPPANFPQVCIKLVSAVGGGYPPRLRLVRLRISTLNGSRKDRYL